MATQQQPVEPQQDERNEHGRSLAHFASPTHTSHDELAHSQVRPRRQSSLQSAAKSAFYTASLAVITSPTMDRYDPSQAPDPEAWLGLDEQERLDLAVEYHRRARIKMPNVKVHAVMHTAVENQLAANDEPVVLALARVMNQGLSRHDAIHAIGSVLAAYIYNALKMNGSPETLRAEYYAAVERLTADEWLNSNDG